jgi:uncharacterized protein
MDQPIPPSSDPQPESTTSSTPAQPQQQPLEQSVTKAFIGPNGIRAGWRVLIFLCIVAGLFIAFGAIVLLLNHRQMPKQEMTAGNAALGEAFQFGCVLLASWIMTKVEGRRLADYGLPVQGAFGGKFWQGIAFGFASITVLLAVMRGLRVFYYGPLGLHGEAMLKYAALWGLAFLLVGFFEEFFMRGYMLFTLTTGMWFWPSAVLLSALFGLSHRSNGGESWLGVFNAGAAGFLFCVILRKTGDLWMAIGFHAAWDWGETYFYGVADSGIVAPGHLFNSHLAGPAWLTGGSVGPEGSWLCLALLIILCIVFAVSMPEAKYPNPDAIPDPRKKLVQPLSIFSVQPTPNPTPPAQS